MSEQPTTGQPTTGAGVPDDVPEADAVEQAQEVAPPGVVDDGPAAPSTTRPADAPEADVAEQEQEVPLDDDERDR